MSLDLKSLELFLRVATIGAIGRAGAEFDLSPTNATQRIKALEDELGVKLFNRTTRSISLTPDGELLCDRAKHILGEIDETRAALSQNTGTLSGKLRVTASASFARQHILPFLPEFMLAHPNLQLDLNLSDSYVDIVQDGYDLAFRMGELEPSSLMAQRIDDNPQWLVATPAYLAAHGTPQTPDDLMHHSCLLLGSMRSWHLRDKNGVVHEMQVRGQVTVNLGDAVAKLVRADMGIGRASLWHAALDLKSGGLVRVLPDYTLMPEGKIWAVRPPGRMMPTRVKTFLNFMQQRIVETNMNLYGDLL
ncbi:LysR family transcriptional regulator [Amylibacter kogurei]|uniref:LysR family transcriptional regulator n=1 Tax=Paramylibacter kogurei TaxID=1889778 RepID=A0A2G5K700_9RHOB|nr:LysR family transcriptional regulator [Amylibacter kogurei]PIB24889.1 LysR family transcriptional regulator [Amylibacter kogurei]